MCPQSVYIGRDSFVKIRPILSEIFARTGQFSDIGITFDFKLT